MECKRIKEIIPQYVGHDASGQDIQLVEEHLCICQDCRDYLGGLLDRGETHHKNSLAKPSPEVEYHYKWDILRWDMLTYIIVGLGFMVVGFLFLLFIKA